MYNTILIQFCYEIEQAESDSFIIILYVSLYHTADYPSRSI